MTISSIIFFDFLKIAQNRIIEALLAIILLTEKFTKNDRYNYNVFFGLAVWLLWLLG